MTVPPSTFNREGFARGRKRQQWLPSGDDRRPRAGSSWMPTLRVVVRRRMFVGEGGVGFPPAVSSIPLTCWGRGGTSTALLTRTRPRPPLPARPLQDPRSPAQPLLCRVSGYRAVTGRMCQMCPGAARSRSRRAPRWERNAAGPCDESSVCGWRAWAVADGN